jgi:methionyl-tRNA synthetase
MKKFGKIKIMSEELISYGEFLEIAKKLNIKYGQVVSAERIPKSDKLLKLVVIFGSEEADEKIVVTNLGEIFEPSAFEGLVLPFVMNLLPSKMMGVTSQAMIMVPKIGDVIELNNYSLGSKLL